MTAMKWPLPIDNDLKCTSNVHGFNNEKWYENKYKVVLSQHSKFSPKSSQNNTPNVYE